MGQMAVVQMTAPTCGNALQLLERKHEENLPGQLGVYCYAFKQQLSKQLSLCQGFFAPATMCLGSRQTAGG